MLPSESGTGHSVSPSVLPGKRPESSKAFSPPLERSEARHVHERLYVVSGRVGDDGAAVGVAYRDDRPLDGLEDAGYVLRIT